MKFCVRKGSPRFVRFSDGVAVCGDGTNVGYASFIPDGNRVPLIVADPPYGNIVSDNWDRADVTELAFCGWMKKWVKSWTESVLLDGGAFYVWGGVGKVGFRPFFRFLVEVETDISSLQLSTLITWAKKRAYGIQHGYLFTREECAYLVKGDAKRPRCFNIPLLEQKRGYAGYSKKYPAKSEFLRRTNVWTDVTEILRGKVHTAQKAQRVIEIPIEVHTVPGEWVVDPFAGSGTTAHAARRLGRRWLMIEKNPKIFDEMVERLRK